MENQKLFDKYSDGNHWENRPTDAANTFVGFLRRTSPIYREIISGNLTIIDLGCGNGRDVNLFAEMNIKAIGIDNDPKIINIAQETYPKNRENFYVCNIERSLYPDDGVYAYFCINVMHYVDQKRVLGEIYRTLKPGGYAFIHFNLLIIDQNYSIDYNQKKSDVYEMVKKFEIVEEKIFLREDSLPIPHTHHVMQVILKKNKKRKFKKGKLTNNLSKNFDWNLKRSGEKE